MLVITRKLDESFMIGDEIEIKLLSVNGKQAKIGIKAPDNFKILRQELFDKAVQSKSTYEN